MQYRVLGADGREYGPVDEQTILQWISEGRLASRSMGRLEGTDAWRPLAEFPEFVAALRKFDPGWGTTQPPVTGEWNPEVLNRDYRLSVGECVDTGWRVYRQHFWQLVLGYLVCVLISVALSLIGIVPVLGVIFSVVGQWLILNPIWAGAQFLCLRAVRGQDVSVEHVFVGFQTRYWQVVAGGLIPGLLSMLLLFFGMVVLGTGTGMSWTLPGAGAIVTVIGSILVVVGLVVAIYLSVCWFFTLILILDRGLRFWPAMCASRAMVVKHWWRVFWMLMVSGFLSAIGLLLCCIGVFLTVPLGMTVSMAAYETIFGTGVSVGSGPTPAQPGSGESTILPGAQAASGPGVGG